MPYVLMSTQTRLECGPCIVGDEHSDQQLMEDLGAKLVKQLGNNFLEWRTEDMPRIILNKLERHGYRVMGMTGLGQTCIWTLHKEPRTDPVAINDTAYHTSVQNGKSI